MDTLTRGALFTALLVLTSPLWAFAQLTSSDGEQSSDATCPCEESVAPSEPVGGEFEVPDDKLKLGPWRLSLLVGTSVLWPASQHTADEFGSNHLGPAIGFWSFRAGKGCHVSVDINWRRFGADLGKINIWNASAGINVLMRPNHMFLIPYWAVRAGPYFAKLPESGWLVRLGAAAEVGVVLGKRIVLTGRYDLQAEERGFDLSTFSARVGVRLF
jgi:hypothetical protein